MHRRVCRSYDPRPPVYVVVLGPDRLGTRSGTAVPPVIRFSGTLAVDAGLVPVTFGLYREEAGREPLWTETQTLVIDAAGRYTVVLGAIGALPGRLVPGRRGALAGRGRRRASRRSRAACS